MGNDLNRLFGENGDIIRYGVAVNRIWGEGWMGMGGIIVHMMMECYGVGIWEYLFTLLSGWGWLDVYMCI
jgi:hypothetical protein